MRRLFFSWLFLFSAVAMALFSTWALDFDQNKVLLYFLLPYFALTVAMQYVWPQRANRFERGEVMTDLLNNAALLGVTWLQNSLVVWMSREGAALPFQWQWVDGRWSAANLPFWGQVLVAWLVFDFMFYVTHRIAHEVPLFWRFHSIHHCAHRLSFLNASRVHPVDIVWRRLVPMFVTWQTGVGAEAMIMANTMAATLAVMTHMNVAFRFGPLNLFIGTNEMHRWHHSNKLEEAKNYSVVMLWDHLFGTYVNPRGRPGPLQMGLFDERFYPIHSFVGQMLIPFRWTAWKARQVEAGPMPDNGGTVTSMPPRTAHGLEPATPTHRGRGHRTGTWGGGHREGVGEESGVTGAGAHRP